MDVQSAARAPGGAFGAAVSLGPAVPPFLELAVGAGRGGGAAVAWGAGPADPGLVVSARGADGVWSAPAKVSEAPPGILLFASDVHVAMNARGDALAVWQEPDGLMSSDLPAGGAWSAPVLIAPSTGSILGASVGLDDAGNALVVVRAPDQATFNFRVMAYTRAAGAAAWSGPVALSPAGPTTGAPGLRAVSPNDRSGCV